MLVRLGVVLVVVLAACSSDDAPPAAASCSDVWVDGADVAAIIDQPCDIDGQPTYSAGFASLDCDDGTEVQFNEYGHWMSDDMTLNTSWNGVDDYSMADVEAACA